MVLGGVGFWAKQLGAGLGNEIETVQNDKFVLSISSEKFVINSWIPIKDGNVKSFLITNFVHCKVDSVGSSMIFISSRAR